MCTNFINKGILLDHKNEINYEMRIIKSEKSKQQSKEQVHFILINSTRAVQFEFFKNWNQLRMSFYFNNVV